jgi:hypothetical protein
MSFETAASAPPRGRQSGRPTRRMPAASRSAITNSPNYMPTSPLNRVAVNRRRRDLVAMLVEACGGEGALSELAMVEIRKAAELVVAAEMARVATLNGTAPVDVAGLTKLENLARRAMHGLAAFGLKVTKVSVGPSPGLAVARKRWAEQDKRKPDGEATK